MISWTQLSGNALDVHHFYSIGGSFVAFQEECNKEILLNDRVSSELTFAWKVYFCLHYGVGVKSSSCFKSKWTRAAGV